MIHPRYGLWHAYRGALAFAERLALSDGGTSGKEVATHPCERCTATPCLTTCPADAVRDGCYDVAACMDFLVTHPDGACMHEGCAARRACPVGDEYVYDPEQARHHMSVFVRHAPRPDRGGRGRGPESE